MTRVAQSTGHRVERAAKRDANDFASILSAAFSPSTIHHIMEPDSTKWPPRYLKAMEEVWDQSNARSYKAVDNSTGKTIGCAVWAALEGDELLGLESLTTTTAPLLLGVGSSLTNEESSSPGRRLELRIAAEARSRRIRCTKGKACQYLAVVAVHPDRQGHGIGETLVQIGMDEADERQVACYLESAPNAFHIYRKLGWVQIDEGIDLDLREYGGEDKGYGNYKFRCMLRLPDARTASTLVLN